MTSDTSDSFDKLEGENNRTNSSFCLCGFVTVLIHLIHTIMFFLNIVVTIIFNHALLGSVHNSCTAFKSRENSLFFFFYIGRYKPIIL